jgi:epoxyqueuosine reductase
MTPSRARREIEAAGQRLGFRRVRVARATALERDDFLAAWLAEGRAGDMRFLLHHRKARLDPRTRYPWARSVVSAWVPYRPPPRAPCDWRAELRGRIAAYALGVDYHDVLGDRLRLWTDAVRDLLPGVEVRSFVDTGAVLEHEWALRSGVGWTGKHTLTLSEEEGSYGFLVELLLGLELAPDEPVPERCGTCTRCIEICPTGAIEPGFRLDPRRCISYLTIEHRGSIPHELRERLGEWVFGCDLCQTVCPWNRDATGPPSDALTPDLTEVLALDDERFAARYGESAVRRTGRVGLARNAAVVLGNTGNPAAVGPLARALAGHDAALVRSHAAWALGRLAAESRDARRALEGARRDADEAVRSEVEGALARRDPSGARVLGARRGAIR